jgi:WD40 repeat protein
MKPNGDDAVKYDTSLKAPELIQKWSEIVPTIKSKLERDSYDEEGSRSDKQLNTTIPNGFQFVKNITLGKAGIKSVFFMTTGELERFGVLDERYAQFYSNGSIYGKFFVGRQRETIASVVKAQFVGTERWKLIAPWKLLITSTRTMELKIIDPLTFKILSTITTQKPVLSMEFLDLEEPLLVVGSAGMISIYKFKNVFKHSKNSSLVEFDSLKKVITDFGSEDWITHLAIDRKKSILYAAYDNNVAIYDLNTFKRIEVCHGLHDESISSLLVWEENGYWITGSKDTTIKIWNTQNFMLYTLKDHLQTISSLSWATVGIEQQHTYLLSSSLDSTVRLWNLDDGKCINKINGTSAIHGITWMKDSTFAIYSDDGVEVWTLNHFFCTFSSLSAPLFSLKTNRSFKAPARIVGYSSDGSVVIITPRTGEKLVIGYPIPSESSIIDGLYDSIQRMFF